MGSRGMLRCGTGVKRAAAVESCGIAHDVVRHVSCRYSKRRGRSGLQGYPTQTMAAGMFVSTVLRAPITAPRPMVTPGEMKQSFASHA